MRQFNFNLTEAEHMALMDKRYAARDVANLRRLYLHCLSVNQTRAAQYAELWIVKLEQERAGELI